MLKRDFFLTRDIAGKVLEAMLNNGWKLIFALRRYGGLRCPSETLSIEWHHVLWEEGKLIVPSPKTEHHEGKEERIIPIFPEIRPYLESAYQERQSGPVFWHERDHSNLAVKFAKILKRNKVKPWPKIFHNLRATRETELAQEYPIQVVCNWIGYSPKVAMRHYLQVTKAHFKKALERDIIRDQNLAEQEGIKENSETEDTRNSREKPTTGKKTISHKMRD